MEDSDDWIVDANGFYIATRSFLMRRGYCCANQCRNCPYINWRDSLGWEPVDAAMVRVTKVSPRAIEGARKALAEHEQWVQRGDGSEEAFHERMIAHYRLLLRCWKEVGT